MSVIGRYRFQGGTQLYRLKTQACPVAQGVNGPQRGSLSLLKEIVALRCVEIQFCGNRLHKPPVFSNKRSPRGFIVGEEFFN